MEMTPALNKRLLPLYIAAFLQGLVLWYPVEKLFISTIGFDNAKIGLMIALYSAVMLVTETPTGILADRWSRRGVLMLSSVALALSSLVGGLSNGVAAYIFASALWGVFFAMFSGANDAIVYDILEEEGHHPDLFDKAYGRVRVLDSAALVIGSLAGGVLASVFGLRSVYFLTIFPALASIVALMWLREPTLHRHKEVVTIADQIRNTLRSVLRNPPLVPIMTVLVMGTVLQYMIFEFAQLWLLALHTPTAWFGPANAVILGTLAVGGWLAQYARRWKLLLLGVMAAMLAGSLGIVTVHNVPGVVLAQFLVLAGAITLDVIFLRNLHDGLTSQIRAGASSAVGSMGRIAIIPFALIFGAVSNQYGIYSAGWILAALAVGIAGFVAVLEVRRRGSRRPTAD